MEHMSLLLKKKKNYSKMIGKLTEPLTLITVCLPASSSQSCTNTGIEQLNAHSQGRPRVVSKMGPLGLF